MRKTREVLRLHSLGVSGREIARTLQLGAGTVSGYLARAKVAGLDWPLPDDLDDAALERKLFVPREENRRGRPLRTSPGSTAERVNDFETVQTGI